MTQNMPESVLEKNTVQNWPQAKLRLEAIDGGIVLRYGDGPDECDILGARDVWVFEDNGLYYMHYDGAGRNGWLCCLAVSDDLKAWVKKGPVLDLGAEGEEDSGTASYGATFFDGKTWHMFYVGSPNTTPAPERVPCFPYLTLKAQANSPGGPWTKQKDIIPFRTKAGTYYCDTASPGHIVKYQDEYLHFFSATLGDEVVARRTLGIARTKDLNSSWLIDAEPIVSVDEQIENSALYYESSNETWFLFTNHVGVDPSASPDDAWHYWYTDAIWVYWTKDINEWNSDDKAIVLDRSNCTWSKVVGLPSVIKVNNKLAMFYDGVQGNDVSHMRRDIGIAWLDLPLIPPTV